MLDGVARHPQPIYSPGILNPILTSIHSPADPHTQQVHAHHQHPSIIFLRAPVLDNLTYKRALQHTQGQSRRPCGVTLALLSSSHSPITVKTKIKLQGHVMSPQHCLPAHMTPSAHQLVAAAVAAKAPNPAWLRPCQAPNSVQLRTTEGYSTSRTACRTGAGQRTWSGQARRLCHQKRTSTAQAEGLNVTRAVDHLGFLLCSCTVLGTPAHLQFSTLGPCQVCVCALSHAEQPTTLKTASYLHKSAYAGY
jgi:hypothetical protein